MTCDKCGSRSGQVFGVNYGKKAGSTLRSAGYHDSMNQPVQIQTTTYEVGGRTTVELCAPCRRKRQRTWLLGFVTTWWVSLVVLVAVSLAVDGDVTWWSTILILLALLLLLVCPFVLLAMLIDGRRHFDERWAQSLRRQDLVTQGWDTLWSDDELAALKSAEPSTLP